MRSGSESASARNKRGAKRAAAAAAVTEIKTMNAILRFMRCRQAPPCRMIVSLFAQELGLLRGERVGVNWALHVAALVWAEFKRNLAREWPFCYCCWV